MNTQETLNKELIIERYTRMKENIRKACRKYNQTHKDKINEIARNYYQKHKDNLEYKAKNCQKSKAAYHRRKQKESQNSTSMDLITNMNYHDFIQHLLKNSLPPVTCVKKGLVREHGGTFETFETTLQWMYINRHILQHKTAMDMLFTTPFFMKSHTHWIDTELEKNWEESENLQRMIEMEADNSNYLTFPEATYNKYIHYKLKSV